MSIHPSLRLASSVSLVLAFLLLVPAPCLAQPRAPMPDAPASPEKPLVVPPKGTADIVKSLEGYAQDAARVARHRAVLAEPVPGGDDAVVLFRTYMARGAAAEAIGATSEQLESFEKAVEWGRISRTDELPRAIGSLANTQMLVGNWLTAYGLYEQSMAAGQGVGGARLAQLTTLTRINLRLGDHAAAKKTMAEAENVFGQLRNSPGMTMWRYNWTTFIERGRGDVLEAEGKLAEAEDAFRRALRNIQQDIPLNDIRLKNPRMSPPQTTTLERLENGLMGNISRVLRFQGKLTEAEGYARQVLENAIKRTGRYSPETAGAINLLGTTFAAQGRYADSVLLNTAAVDTFEKAGASPDSQSLVFARQGLGAGLVSLGHWQEALAVYEAMRAGIRTSPELARRFGGGNVFWAYALVRAGRAETAAQMTERIYKNVQARAGDTDYGTLVARGYHAVALAASNKKNDALGHFAAAVPRLIEQQRADQASESGGPARSLHLTRIIEAYLALLADMHGTRTATPGLDPVAEAFRLADVARSSNVQRALSASAARASIADPQLADLARREQDASRRIGTLADFFSAMISAPPEQQLPKIIAQMRLDLDKLRAERLVMKQEIERRFPDYANLVDPRPITLAQAQAALSPGEALVSIYVSDERSYVWAIPQKGGPAFALLQQGAKDIATKVTHLRQALDPDIASGGVIPPYDLASAHQLYTQLLVPVESGWKDANSLLVVPHGALGSLPFGLLVTSPDVPRADGGLLFDRYQKVFWLLRQAAITQLPSVSAFITLRRLPPPAANRLMFAGFGDPLFSKSQETAVEPQRVAAVDTRGGLRLRLRNAPRLEGMNSAELATLPRLPDTNEEIREIARALGVGADTDIYTQARASETNVKTADLSNRRVIAFATHGLVPGELDGLTQPALAMSSPEVTGAKDEDGLLAMDEILALKLNADWVVLSACNTASGDGAGSEAVSGLGRAFFYAGARALLVSNWPVETVSARLIMTDLFRRQARQAQLTRTEALRQTLLALIDGPGAADAAGKAQYSYAHPLFWSPFSLVGDGAGR